MSDLHWDNPKCDRDRLKRDLDKALKENIKVIINGDFFCLMQGKYDPRGSKKDVRPEHNHNDYFDRIIDTAVEWFKPYHSIIDFIGRGNHEQSILKRQETDILRRFVDMFNMDNRGEHTVQVGGYGGWYVIAFESAGKRTSYKIKYFHGSGGGGPVTKGIIQFNRKGVSIEGADLIWMGHVHEDMEVTQSIETLNGLFKPKLKDVLYVRTSTYKEEYGDNYSGWHSERGAQPKTVGSRLLEIDYSSNKDIFARTTKF